MTAPGQGTGPNGSRGAASGSGQNPNSQLPGYGEQGGAGVGGHGHSLMMDDAYGPRHGQKREELADQKLMDDLKKGESLCASLMYAITNKSLLRTWRSTSG